MRRRDFLTLIGSAAAAGPLAVRAQETKLPVIGFLGSESPPVWTDQLRAFHEGLGQTGYADARNIAIEYRWAEGHYDRLPGLATELVRRQVSVIVAPGGVPSVIAARAATTSIPIVFRTGADPVSSGFVKSLNRPDANLTGVTALNAELDPKRLELLHEMVPAATSVAVLANPTNPLSKSVSKGVAAAAGKLGLAVHIMHASTERELDELFAGFSQLRVGGLLIQTDNFLGARQAKLAGLALRQAVPAILGLSFARAGGLLGYGANPTDPYRVVGIYTGRILKGEKPADLPVQQSTKIELIINLRTAKALGLTVPLTLQYAADEVIE